MTALDERKASILRAVVTEYVETACPVGSSHVSRSPGVDVSSATVRHEMATLEQEGYLAQPHTSAGRVPTDKGYRFFVDQLSAPGDLDPPRRQLVREFFASAHGELERMLEDTTSLLSHLTDYAAVVVGPGHETSTIRSAQLVDLGHAPVLAVLVCDDGSVEKRLIDVGVDVGPERVGAASAHMASHLVGVPRSALKTGQGHASVVASGDQVTDAVVAAAVAAFADQDGPDDSEQVFMGGVSRMAEAFDAVETVRRVLNTLEQQFLVVTLLRDVLDRGLSVAIGTEHGVVPLAECAVVVAPFSAGGDEAGTIGVLGPSRMNYSQALAAVALVSQRLGSHLSEG